jgi:hypothetical protein
MAARLLPSQDFLEPGGGIVPTTLSLDQVNSQTWSVAIAIASEKATLKNGTRRQSRHAMQNLSIWSKFFVYKKFNIHRPFGS